MTNWKPPRITERTAIYTKQFDNMTAAEKLEHFDNIVRAAFRKGYSVRKGDERKMRAEKVHNAKLTGLAPAQEIDK